MFEYVYLKNYKSFGEVRVDLTDKHGNPKWKEKTVKGQKVLALDSNGNKIPIMTPVKVWDNMDWNILDYVKTDYHELTNADFIKTMRNYKLFQYMVDNNLLFTDNNSPEKEEEKGEE